MVANWEYSYNGLTFGGSNAIGVTQVDGLDPPDYREDVSTRMGAHGGYVFAAYLDTRRIVFDGDFLGTDINNTFSNLNTLRTAFVPQPSGDLPLVFQQPGFVQQRIFCKPTRVAFPLDVGNPVGLFQWHVELLAADPLIYADTLATATLAANTTGSALNSGIMPTYFESATITGPGTTFTIKDNADATKTIKINTTLTGGQSMVVDFQDRTIFRNDLTNLYGSLDTTSQWWYLAPNATTTVNFQVASGSTGATQCVLNWRSAWL